MGFKGFQWLRVVHSFRGCMGFRGFKRFSEGCRGFYIVVLSMIYLDTELQHHQDDHSSS